MPNSSASTSARRARRRGGALCHRHHSGDRRADRPKRSTRSDRPPVHSRLANSTAIRANAPIRSATTPKPRRGHRSSLSRPRAAQAHASLRGLLPLLFSPRDGRAGRACARRGRTRPGACLHRARPEIWEVVLTGGDPLMLSPRRIAVVSRPCGDRASYGNARAYAPAGGGSCTHHAGAGARAEISPAKLLMWCSTPTIRAN